MAKNKFLNILGELAPVAASAYGGPWWGVAARKIADVFGLGPDASDAEIEKAVVAANPEILVKLRQVEADFKRDMEKLEISRDQIAADDRKDARAMRIALKDPLVGILAVLIIGGFFGVLGAMIFGEVPNENETAVNIMLGALGGLTVQIGNYFFGSSKGSKDKDDFIKGLGMGSARNA